MKQIYLFLFIITILSVTSCEYLDQEPDNLTTAESIWETASTAEGYLYGIYSYVNSSDGGSPKEMGFSDESIVSIAGTAVRYMTNGNWSASSWYDYEWASNYEGIRRSFVFEENINKVPSSELSDDLKAQYTSEVYFLRGYFYWKLLRKYGPFVILNEALSQNDNFHQYARNTFEDCVAHINGLMDSAAEGLPLTWSSTSYYGRPVKGTCLAIKSQVALLAASPLWNGNSYFSNFKNYDGTALAPSTYDANKWKTAADAAKAVIDINVYSLYTGGANAYENCRDLFLTNWNDEIIFSDHNWGHWGWTKCCTPLPGGYNMYNITQNLVDAFYMSNGRTIDDDASGYTETGFIGSNSANSWGHRRGEWNMYANREPRFYAFIQYNMHPVVPAPSVDDKNYYSSGANQDGTGRVEFYYTGKSGQSASPSYDLTGYLPLKRISAADNIREDKSNYHAPYILIRYAEILLNYVEALNEYAPSNPDIVTYLNIVRSRAGIPGIDEVYPEAVGDQDVMRKYILRERQIELCFEGDRANTTIRRLTLGNTENQKIYGMSMKTTDGGQGFAFEGFYNRTLVETRTWDDKMYLYPMQQTDIERANLLVQNPGWSNK